VIEIVFAEVVLGEIGDVGLLNVRDVGGSHYPNVHDERWSNRKR
jgi:hypothetical protein